MYKLDKCALCGKSGDMKLSHIVPDFVGRYLKKTSISGIRNTEKINKQAQDIEKHYILCGECEELFSAKERWFANYIFYPYFRDSKDSFEYNENLHFFLTSLSWRSLYLDIMDCIQDKNISIDSLQCLINSELIMKNYLLNKKNDIGEIENHIFFFDRIEKLDGEYGDKIKRLNPHVSMHRGIASYSVWWYENLGTYFTITNMLGIIVVTFYKKGTEEQWINTKVECRKGNITARDQQMRSVVPNELKHMMELFEEQKEKLSEKQKEKIVNKILSVGEELKNYDIYGDMNDDKNLK